MDKNEAYNLHYFQREVGEWAREIHGESTLYSKVEHFTEEAVELVKSYDPKEQTIDPLEAADCLIMLLNISNQQGFSLMEMARLKFEINKKRKWANPDERGIVRHIEDSTTEESLNVGD